MSTSNQLMVDPSTCNLDEADLSNTFAGMSDLEHYPTGYQSTSAYVTKPPEVGLPKEQNNAEGQDCATVSAVRYLQASHYEDMPDYEMSTCPLESRYLEDQIAYGYVSDVNLGFPIDEVNGLSTRPVLFNDNLNCSDSTHPTDITSGTFESQFDFHEVSRFTLTDGVSHIRDSKNMLLKGSEIDIGSAMRWRDPNLSEVISFLNNPNNEVKANAAAYLQHLCYMDDPNKQRTRSLGGIPPLIRLLAYDVPEIHKNACGALRNLSYGRQNDENKRAIKNSDGITALVNLLCRTKESEVKELVTGVLWNMSSCEDIKSSIIDESLNEIVRNIIITHSGWDAICPGETCYSTVFRNATGILRNVSSAGEYARTSLRNSEHLVECLIYVVQTAIEKNNINNKTVENCVCILRNLSYRCQEVEDPNYDQHPMVITSRPVTSPSKGENLGCFGTSKKKRDFSQNEQQENLSNFNSLKISGANNSPAKGFTQLWQPEVVQYYLALLQSCSNPETLEAAAGAIQNLSACYWQPSIDIRATVRKEKGLPILVELLRMEVDRVVCAVATALRNLAIDQRNKELIGKYAMRDLVQKLPSGNPQHDQNTSDDTITAVLATINEVIKKNPEFSRSLLDAGGVDRLFNITKQRQKYTSCVLKFASQVLFTMWQHHELRDVYKKHGWKEQDFITKYLITQNPASNSPNNANNTLNRPMASQSRTRYEDKTMHRVQNSVPRKSGNDFAACHETAHLCQMTDDISIGSTGKETYHRGASKSKMPLYIPIVDSGQNNSN